MSNVLRRDITKDYCTFLSVFSNINAIGSQLFFLKINLLLICSKIPDILCGASNNFTFSGDEASKFRLSSLSIPA